jgi:hypothetical protein
VEYEVLRHMSNHWGTGIITKGLQKYVETGQGKHSVESLQTTAHKRKSDTI